ncbi:unnamed protein product, partial [Mesorhabditis spiculigera]
MNFRDWFVFYSVFVFGFISILSNIGALIVVKRNQHLSFLVATYLCMEHLARIGQSLILFYPGACTFIRTDAEPNLYARVSDQEPYGYYIYRKHRSICEAQGQFGAQLNLALGIIFLCTQHAIEIVQLGVSINRLAALAFEGRYSELVSSTKLHQLLAVWTIPVTAIYYMTMELIVFFEAHSYALITSEYGANILRDMMFKLRMLANCLTLGALFSDIVTFFLIRQHLKKNLATSRHDPGKSRADHKLAKQMIVNHTYSLAVTAVNFYVAFLFQGQIDSLYIEHMTEEDFERQAAEG